MDSDDIEPATDWRELLGGPAISWSDLLEKQFVVILGEAGVGKTSEMRAQARSLRDDGHVAVFVRFEELGRGAIEDALDSPDAAAYAAWNRATEEAYFFLDAIDEAKLNSAGAFYRCLRMFVRTVANSGQKIQVFLSCRPSDWQHRTDLAALRSAFQSLGRKTTTTELFRDTPNPHDSRISAGTIGATGEESRESDIHIEIVRLRPLDQNQIEIMASAYGIEDISDFLGELRSKDRLFLAERPRDLEWLTNYWKRNRLFGTLWGMLEASVSAKLIEQNPSHSHSDPLSPERARRAVETLAAATVLCRLPAIRIPDPEMEVERTQSALDAQLVLDDWPRLLKKCFEGLGCG